MLFFESGVLTSTGDVAEAPLDFISPPDFHEEGVAIDGV